MWRPRPSPSSDAGPNSATPLVEQRYGSRAISTDTTARGAAALADGRWADARAAFEASIDEGDTAYARLGLATALWWLGENRASVDQCTAAYALFRKAEDTGGAVDCALWLAITYKANFDNFAAANGWIARAERLLESVETGPAHAWAWVTRAYRLADLDTAATLTQQALDVARPLATSISSCVAASQLGLILVGQGDTAGGFALIDESMAAALGGEPSDLQTVVYTCCDMLNACELTGDADRAVQWCRVADRFVETYGCPFLYAECRIYYGSVLTAAGRWDDAERELGVGKRITADSCPSLHRKALTRLASLRVRQGRLEEAEQLLDAAGGRAETAAEITLSTAALLLARGDGAGAARLLEHRWRTLEQRRAHAAAALDLLVDAQLARNDVDAATVTATRLANVAGCVDDRVAAVSLAAEGRVADAAGDRQSAATCLEAAAARFARIGAPFEAARAHFALAGVVVGEQPELAISHAERALAGFEDLGAALDTDRVAAFLRAMGVATRPGPKGLGVLTAREQEVLALLGHGLSNAEIGARLYVSPKTAAHHVSRILRKLNLRNRAEAAVFTTGRDQSRDRLVI